MKTHAIIPIFIPHAGCTHDCVFCNQKAITARSEVPSVEDTDWIIRRNLETIRANPSITTVEIAFYGGSFTAIPMEMQKSYLQIASRYKREGAVDRIHLSTRPDAIDDEILDQLVYYGVDIVELGVQSFDQEVLRQSARGHDPDCVFRSSEMIRNRGITLGIQLMTGLPGDSREKCLYSAEQAILTGASIARIYPTIVIRDTALYSMYCSGSYQPPSLEETVRTVKDMYRRLTGAGIQVIRVGLKSTDLIREDNGEVAGGYHPAFRQLVEAEIAKEDLEKQLLELQPGEGERISFCSSPVSFSNMIGHKKSNRQYFSQRYPSFRIRYEVDRTLPPDVYMVRTAVAEETPEGTMADRIR